MSDIEERLRRIEDWINQVRPGWIFKKDNQTRKFWAQVQKLHRITIPSSECKRLGIEEGDWVEVAIRLVEKG